MDDQRTTKIRVEDNIVEDIWSKRMRYGCAELEYYIKWKRYDSSGNTWEPRRHLDACQKILREFERRWQREKKGSPPFCARDDDPTQPPAPEYTVMRQPKTKRKRTSNVKSNQVSPKIGDSGQKRKHQTSMDQFTKVRPPASPAPVLSPNEIDQKPPVLSPNRALNTIFKSPSRHVSPAKKRSHVEESDFSMSPQSVDLNMSPIKTKKRKRTPPPTMDILDENRAEADKLNDGDSEIKQETAEGGGIDCNIVEFNATAAAGRKRKTDSASRTANNVSRRSSSRARRSLDRSVNSAQKTTTATTETTKPAKRARPKKTTKRSRKRTKSPEVELEPAFPPKPNVAKEQQEAPPQTEEDLEKIRKGVSLEEAMAYHKETKMLRRQEAKKMNITKILRVKQPRDKINIVATSALVGDEKTRKVPEKILGYQFKGTIFDRITHAPLYLVKWQGHADTMAELMPYTWVTKHCMPLLLDFYESCVVVPKRS